MNKYQVVFQVKDSGAGICKQEVQAGGEYNARRLVEASYGKDKVQIITVHHVG